MPEMVRALKVCSRAGCPNLTPTGRCDSCRAEAERLRGSATARGYGSRHRTRFRKGVLTKHPTCRLCGEPSTVADHWPLSRRELAARGFDPDDPAHGRGLCKTCHDQSTSERQPGGWNAQ